MTNRNFTFEDFCQIIAVLRGENGCPWDKVQTHNSMRACMMEEAAEVLSAIRILDETGDSENLCEELGDVLLQVVLHSDVAKRENHFTIDDVIDYVSNKMIRRHPHVTFPDYLVEKSELAVIPEGLDINVKSKEKVLQNWDEIKKKEKENKTYIENPLREIPKEFPSLTRAPKVLKKIDKLIAPIESEAEALQEIKDACAILEKSDEDRLQTDLEKQLQEMLWNISKIASKNKISLEQLLFDKIEDTIENYENNRNIV